MGSRRRTVAIVALLALSMCLMGQGYNVPFNPRGAATTFCDTVSPTPDLCEDFEENQATCTNTSASGVLGPLAPTQTGTPDCADTSSPIGGGSYQAAFADDGSDGEEINWNPASVICTYASENCQIRGKFMVSADADSNGNNPILVMRQEDGTTICGAWYKGNGNLTGVMCGAVNTSNDQALSFDTTYNICVTYTTGDDCTVEVDTGATWCSGVFDTVTRNDCGGATDVDVITSGENASDNAAWAMDEIRVCGGSC